MMDEAEKSNSAELILVVDDLYANRFSLESLLKRAGFRVQTASDGLEALQSIQRETPDLVLLDVLMPGMKGTEVLRQIKTTEETRLIPVVLLSIQSAVSDRIDGLEHGADDYIGKPFNNEELLAKIRALLKIRQLNEQLREAEKLAVLAQVAVSVNHGVNNPLTSILYATDLLEFRLAPEDKESRVYLETIRENLERIQNVMSQLRNATEIVPVQYLRGIQMLDLPGLESSTSESDTP